MVWRSNVVSPEVGLTFTGYLDADSVVSFLIHAFHGHADRMTHRWWTARQHPCPARFPSPPLSRVGPSPVRCDAVAGSDDETPVS
jgi:hypothetical protein